MIQTRLQISSNDYYSCELTKRIPVRVTIVTIQLPEGFGYVEALEGGESNIQEYIEENKKSNSIIEIDVTYKSPSVYWTRTVHKLDFPSIYETVLETGNMSVLPITIFKGVQHHTVLSPTRDKLKSLLKVLKSRFSAVKIISLSSTPLSSLGSILTDKQSEAFLLAINKGYYHIPRRCKITDLAIELNLKRVAVQERLRRSEFRILNDYYNRIQSIVDLRTRGET